MRERSRPESDSKTTFADEHETQEEDEHRVEKISTRRALVRAHQTLKRTQETQQQLAEAPVELVPAKVRRATTSQLERLSKKIRDNTKSLIVAIGVLYGVQLGIAAAASGMASTASREHLGTVDPDIEEVERIARDILSLEARVVQKVAPGLTGLRTFQELHPTTQDAPEAHQDDMPENREELMEEVNTAVLKQARLELQTGRYPLDERFEDWQESLYRDAAHLVEQRHGVRLHLQSEDFNGTNPGVNLHRLVSTHAKNILTSDPHTAVAMVETLDEGGGYILALQLQDPYLASEMIHRYVHGNGDIKLQLDSVVSRPEDLKSVAAVMRPDDRTTLLNLLQEDLDGLRTRNQREGDRLSPFIVRLEEAIAALGH